MNRNDRGVLYGDGLFETLRVQSGKACFLERHLRRFRRSAAELCYPSSIIEEAAEVLETLEGRPDGLWRVTVIRPPDGAPGAGEGGVFCSGRELPVDEAAPTLTVLSGFHFPGDLMAEHKTTSWLRSLEARRRAEKLGFDEAVMVSPDGRVGEAAAANLFLRIRGRWVTPVIDGLLPGIIREALLDEARKNGLAIKERPVFLEDLHASETVVLTSSRRLASAAASIDGRILEKEPAEELKVLLEGDLK